jgi:uncharacterized protein (DUF302 family)
MDETDPSAYSCITSLIASPSPYGITETVDRLAAVADARGMSVYARIDHGAGARAVGLELPDGELTLAGDPRVGTLLIQGEDEGSELPLRVLVWVSLEGTQVGFPDPEEVAAAFRLDGRTDVLERMRAGLEELVAEATA